MKIFTGEIPKNPHLQRHADNTWSETSASRFYREGQQSILNQCVDIDVEKLAQDMDITEKSYLVGTLARIEQFIQEQIQEKHYTAVHNQDGSIDVYPQPEVKP